jgi:hypothetical protein
MTSLTLWRMAYQVQPAGESVGHPLRRRAGPLPSTSGVDECARQTITGPRTMVPLLPPLPFPPPL